MKRVFLIVLDSCGVGQMPDAEQFGGKDTKLLFTTVEIVDKDGNPCPHAANRLTFAVTGAAKFRAATNGDPTDPESFEKPSRRAFHGKLVVVLEATGQGHANLTVSGEELTTSSAGFSVTAERGTLPD